MTWPALSRTGRCGGSGPDKLHSLVTGLPEAGRLPDVEAHAKIAVLAMRMCAMRFLVIPSLLALTACATASADQSECSLDYAAIKAEEMAIIDRGIQVYARVHPDERTEEQLAQISAAFDLLSDRERPVDTADAAILERALELFSSEAVWNREDDRDCGPDGDLYSIFCALQQASIDVIGEYQHRRTALQEVRFIIGARSEGRDYAHRMQDYNNDPRTSFAEARSTMEAALNVVRDRLELQARCELPG